MKKIDFLRKKYPRFVYEKYFYRVSKNNLKIFFNFKIYHENGSRSINLQPKIIIPLSRSDLDRGRSDLQKLDNLIFHLGLVEIPSYWKATCSPKIIIKAGYLDEKQIQWWQDLFVQGMGQFFYENKIDWRNPNFLKIDCAESDSAQSKSARFDLNGGRSNLYLVPIGGGKDSIVTLEKLKERKKRIGCFLVNPTEAAKDVVRISGIKDLIIVRRKIDPTLLELNNKGYLNGHTPITAVLSFLSLFCAVLFDYQRIVFSNEKSADEGNVRYLGKIINHQWSKSSEFEKMFRQYSKKYLTSQVEYFSFLRKYTELEIAGMFAEYPRYFPVFSSCNLVVSKKLNRRWCGNTPKSLFVYATLYPFIEKGQI